MFKRSKQAIDLNRVGIATPCTMSWEGMQGDARVRHCGDCKLNVFNISELSKSQAEDLIARSLKGERVCVRLSRRDDGTIITRDCPTGVRRVRRQRLGISAACAAAFAFLLGVFAHRAGAEESTTMGAPAVEPARLGEVTVEDADQSPPPPPKRGKPKNGLGAHATMGKIYIKPEPAPSPKKGN